MLAPLFKNFTETNAPANNPKMKSIKRQLSRTQSTTSLMLYIGFALLVSGCEPVNISHDQPWSPEGIETEAKASNSDLQSRIILIGDAGAASLEPLEASLVQATKLAKKAPEKTTVVMLGDNIYMKGFPTKAPGQVEYDDEQKEDISHLEAQLEIAKRSGAEMFFVPGNHDWYAEELGSQSQFIRQYSQTEQVKAKLEPFHAGHPPKPEVIHRPGVSLIFLDSQWMISNSSSEISMTMNELNRVIGRTVARYPDNIVVLNAHHPLETMGPHALYYTDRVYPAFVKIVGLFYKDIYQQDQNHEDYQRYMNSLDKVLANYPDSKIVFAAGHDHSLQIFGSATDRPPQYRLVSGAGSLDKISGVGHNEKTLFAVAQQGFLALEIYEEGALIKAYTSADNAEAFSYWLWRNQ